MDLVLGILNFILCITYLSIARSEFKKNIDKGKMVYLYLGLSLLFFLFGISSLKFYFKPVTFIDVKVQQTILEESND
jgi:hypothetical protein